MVTSLSKLPEKYLGQEDIVDSFIHKVDVENEKHYLSCSHQ